MARQQPPHIVYEPHYDYKHQRLPGFHRPLAPRQIELGIPMQPLRPALHQSHSPTEQSRRVLPERPFRPSVDIIETKSPYLMPPPMFPPPPGPQRTSLQCLDDPLKSQFSPYNQTHPSGKVVRIQNILTRYFVEWWMLEILSWTVSALCMASILGVLSFYDGKELPQWFLGLTLNGFISVFSSIAKASLLVPIMEALGQLKWNWFHKDARTLMDFEIMDAASRGPWGCFALLARLRGRGLACIGAVIILAALPLDFFFQQIVIYPEVWIPVTTPAAMPRAISYHSADDLFSNINNEGPSLQEDNFLMTSLVTSFYSNGTIPSLDKLYCPTSNCTWEPFETLGVCSSCDDSIAQDLSFGCFQTLGDWISTAAPNNASSFNNITACGYWINATSDSRVLMTGYEVDLDTNQPREALEMRVLPLIDELTRDPAYGSGSLNFKDISNPLVDFFVVGTPGGAANVYQNVTPVAHECVLHWCVQQISSSYYWGRVSDNVSQTWYNTQDPEQAQSPWIVDTLDGQPDYYYPQNISIKPSDFANTSASIRAHSVTFDKNDTYTLDNYTVISTTFLLDNFAPSFSTLTSASSDVTYTYNIPDLQGFRRREMGSNPWLPPYDTVEHVEKMATIMSTVLRISAGNGGDLVTVAGTAWDTRVHVFIRWPWIILPTALLVISLIFIIATIVKSTKEEGMVGIYKNSAIAILFNGVGDDVQRSVGPNCRLGYARDKARELKVKLVPE